MANTKSAKRAVRVTLRRALINKQRRSQMRTMVRKAEAVLAAGNTEIVNGVIAAAASALAKAANHNIIHKNAMARKISRLTKRAKKLTAVH